MSQSMFCWLDASCVMTVILLSIAFFSTGSRDSGDMGTTHSELTFCAMRSSMIGTCSAASAFSGPFWNAVTFGLSVPNFLTPVSMTLNQLMPVILTTVAIWYFSALAAGCWVAGCWAAGCAAG